ncbi:putative T7SS-secreted protein [Streptomyces sp. NPDC007983]|uniref:putative T7SS-secreted protein n=1 Tax=Streptomyces sp. NPDC007983 TaxID=3364800 RepID=UPI0036EDADD6
MGIGDFVPDGVEDWVGDRVEDVGGAIDATTDWGADRLDDVGLNDAADYVRDKGDEAANALGADVDELQLDQTEDEKKLIRGNPEKLRGAASHLTDFMKAFEKVAGGLKGLDSHHLKGKTADAFREKVSIEPPRWYKAADACEKAAAALKDFAGTVEWAQGQAKLAVKAYKRGKKASDAHRKKVDAYNTAVTFYNAQPEDERDPDSLPDKPAAADPGAAAIKEAEETLAEARRQRNEAQTTVKKVIDGARDLAPEKPSYGEQAKDGLTGLQLDASHFAGGVIKGSAGVLNFGRSLNPTDPYNLTHPAEYLTGLNNTAAGVVRMANDPVGTVKNAWNGFKQDPAEGFGRLVPEMLGTRGIGTAKSALTAGKAAKAVPKPPMPKPPPPKDWSHLARATPESPERAIHAGSVQPHEAKAFIDDQYPWLKDVNNTGHPGYTNNCSHNVVAVDRRLDGHEVSAAPKQAGDHIPPHQLGLYDRPKGQYNMVEGYDDIVKDLNARGEGARSAVYISRSDGSAHVFNAVQTRHGTVFLDGQSGQLGKLELWGPNYVVNGIGHIPYR